MKYLIAIFLLLLPSLAYAQNPGGSAAGVGDCIHLGQVVGRINANSPPTCVAGGGAAVPINSLPAQTGAYNGQGQAFSNLGGISSTGPTSLIGSSFNGSDLAKNLCVNGVCPVTAFGASGSAATCSGTIAANSTSLAVSGCSPSNDFLNGQYVLVPQAGPAALTVSPPSPTVTGHGAFTGGAQTWGYKVAYRDRWGGIKAASSEITLATGAATANGVDYASIILGSQTYTYCDAAVYRTTAPGGIPTGLIAFTAGCSTNTTIQDTNLPVVSIAAAPATPPSADLNQYLVAKIVSGGGTATLTLATGASSVAPGTAVTIIHDETQAFQNTVNAALTIGGMVRVPPGTYNINQPSWWNGSTWIYTNPTDTTTTANEMLGMVHLGSNLTVEGDDWEASKLVNGYNVTSHNPILAVANPTATRLPGAVCNTGATNDFTKKLINNSVRGQSYVVTTTAADAGTFSIGDMVDISGGVVSGNVSCNSTSINEPNVVTGVDATNGNIQLAYGVPTEMPWGTPGTASFIAKINTWYFKNITIRNLTLNSASGAARLGVGSTIKARIDHVKMTGPAWFTTFNISGSRDIALTNSYWHVYSDEELDQVLDVTLDHNTIVQNDGGAQLSFDNGADGVTFTHNIVSSNDFYSGLGARAGSVTVWNGPCINDVEIADNTFNVASANASINTVFVMGASCAAAGEPRPFNWTIARNKIKQAIPAGTGGIIAVASSSIDKLVFSANEIYTTGNSNSDLSLWTGLITDNNIEDAGTVGSALINITNTTGATTIPIVVKGNTIKSGSGVCIKTNSTQTTPLTIGVNQCSTSGNPVLVLNSGQPSYIEPQVLSGGGVYNPTTIPRAFNCAHGMSLPTIGTGAITAGGTDCSFLATGATSPATVTFGTSFLVAPNCNCSDQTSATAAKVVPATGSVVVTTTGTDSFSCTCN